MFTPANLRRTGYVEGTSLIILLFIAMPARHYFGLHEAVRIVGWVHGLLFIWYVVFLALTVKRNPMPWWTFPLGFVGAIVPFGPFVFEALLGRSMRRQASA